MSSYTNFKFALVLIVASFLFLSAMSIRTGEVFPIFSWSLFSSVPQAIRRDAAIEVTMIDGRALEKPIDFMASGEIFRAASEITSHKLIQKLYGALRRKKPEEARRLRLLLQDKFFESRNIRYRLVRRKYHLIERWNGGGYEVLRVVGSWENKKKEST